MYHFLVFHSFLCYFFSIHQKLKDGQYLFLLFNNRYLNIKVMQFTGTFVCEKSQHVPNEIYIDG
jgi:hypothetical protein